MENADWNRGTRHARQAEPGGGGNQTGTRPPATKAGQGYASPNEFAGDQEQADAGKAHLRRNLMNRAPEVKQNVLVC